MARPRLPKSVEELADWYMRYVSPLSLIAGFIADNLFLARRVDVLLTNVLLFTYLVVAALGIVFINLIQTGRLRHWLYLKALPLLPVVAQFAFGGLFSAYLSLYSRSAAISISWIFIIILVVLVVGNERFAHFYARFLVQISLYFTVLFSFLIFFLPVVFHTIVPAMFILSGLVSLALIALFLKLLTYLIPEVIQRERTRVARSIAVIFIVFNALYFSNAIPPLPLALKDGGVYHSIVKHADGTYVLEEEPIPWWDVVERYNTVFHQAPGESAVVWSAVFAPNGISTTVLHEWQYYDGAAKEWRTTNTEQFPIIGGRDGGYRGYSIKSNLQEGKWRVNVLTEYGRLIARISFSVVRVADPVDTVAVER